MLKKQLPVNEVIARTLQELSVPLTNNGNEFPLYEQCTMESAQEFWYEALHTAGQTKEIDQKTIKRLRDLGYVQ